jgi:hypothetical protein
MNVAAAFRLDARAAREVLAQVTRAVAGWRGVAEAHGLGRHDCDVMAPAFEHAESAQAHALIARI